ncbi:MAG: hypothetical protein QOI47_2602 [Actinomycetota bacterium]|nr:hypothetical protein [Actinomycetota bacterium]
MRRLPAIVVVALLVGCGGGGGGTSSGASIVDRTGAVPKDVRAFLARIVDPGTVRFTATYALLNKNGGATHEVHVVSETENLRIDIDGTAVDAHDDVALSTYGIFSGFLAANPKAAIEAAARRADAGPARFPTRGAAGLTLDCVAIPVQGATTYTACISPAGVIGYVDSASVRYELTAFARSA